MGQEIGVKRWQGVFRAGATYQQKLCVSNVEGGGKQRAPCFPPSEILTTGISLVIFGLTNKKSKNKNMQYRDNFLQL